MTLGPPIRKEKPPPPEWRPVEGKPHFFVNAKGQMKYEPPDPTIAIPVPIDSAQMDFS